MKALPNTNRPNTTVTGIPSTFCMKSQSLGRDFLIFFSADTLMPKPDAYEVDDWEDEQKKLDRQWYNSDEGFDDTQNPFDVSDDYAMRKEKELEVCLFVLVLFVFSSVLGFRNVVCKHKQNHD